jgi:hypothetical protein
MPDPQPVDYDALAREAGGTAIDDAAAEFGGVEVSDDQTPDFSTRTTPADGIAPSLMQQAAARSAPVLGTGLSDAIGAYTDVQVGAAKGAGNTALSLSKLAMRMPAMQALVSRATGLSVDEIERRYAALDEAVKPTNTAQAIGRTGEQIAETLIPGRLVTRGATAAAAYLPRGLQTAGRMVVEGSGGAGMAAAQGSDPRVAGVVSAALPGAGALVRGGRRVLGNGVAPEIADAVAMAEARGIPVDAATATGSKVTQATQNLVGRGTLAGLAVREGHEKARVAAMRRVAGELAEEASPASAIPETAGKGAREGIKARVREFYDRANNAYADLRDIAARPENTRLVPRTPKEAVNVVVDEAAKEGLEEVVDTAMFRPSSKRPGELWQAVLADAKRHGYGGSPSQLRALFDQRLGDAQGLVDELSSENYGRKFLQFIADNGGVGIREGDLSGEVARLREMTAAAKANARVQGAIGGVRGVVRPKAGVTVDRMMERLRQSEFGPAVADQPDSVLFDLIEEAAQESDSLKVGPLEALAQLDVRPGQQWWRDPGERAAEAAAKEAAKYESMALPVHIAPLKDGLRDLHAELTELLPVGQQQYDRGLKALQNVMDAPDYMPAARLDKNLSAIKAMARGAEMDELRNESQGLAAHIVGRLEDAVQSAVTSAGPEAVAARNAGREATKAKADAAVVLKQLRKKSVQAFEQLTTRQDHEIALLRDVQRLAPKEVPKLGRAYLEKLFEKGAARDGWSRENGLLAQWESLGPETKKLLYPNPALRRDLDAFFKLAVKAAENTNPSGSGWQVLLGSQGFGIASAAATGNLPALGTGVGLQIPAYAVAKMLYSPHGVRLLTQGLKIRTLSPAAAANVLEQLRRAGERAATTTPAAVPASPAPTPSGRAR